MLTNSNYIIASENITFLEEVLSIYLHIINTPCLQKRPPAPFSFNNSEKNQLILRILIHDILKKLYNGIL